MNPNLTDITVILDRSGSMNEVRQDTVGGYNRFLRDQQDVPGECLLTLVQFDSQNAFEILHRGVPIRAVKPLALDQYVPRGGTPLLDAVGQGINDTGERLKLMLEKDRPSKVIFVVLTDGEENESKKYKSKDEIKQMVSHQHEVYKWEFVFIGADIDAFAEGASMGFAAGSTLQMTKNAAGIHAAYASTSANVAGYRTGQNVNTAYSDADRQAQEEAAQQDNVTTSTTTGRA